jgi:hypothetical protein
MSQETEFFHGLTTDDAKDDRSRLRAVFLGLCGVCGLALFLLALGACTKPNVPLCEKYQARVVQNADGETFVLLDMANVKKLAQLISGLQDGTCRIGAPEPEGRGV